ncbi:MAG: anti-sigma factor domain-containing protein [Solirubrobacteraceae bacterium]
MEPNLTAIRHATTGEILGAYALGAVDEREAAAVREHLATCAACRAELGALWIAGDNLAEVSEPLDPPPALRERIAAAVLAEVATQPRGAPPAALPAPPVKPVAVAVPPARPVAEPVRPARWWSRPAPWAAAAAILLVLAAGLLAWNLRLREEIATEPAVQTVALAPTDAAPQASGEVRYDPSNQLFVLAVRDLPPLPSGQVYEVWLIGAQGPPVPAGVFAKPTAEHAIIADRSQYQTLAITAEPGPLGSTAPTGQIVATATLS